MREMLEKWGLIGKIWEILGNRRLIGKCVDFFGAFAGIQGKYNDLLGQKTVGMPAGKIGDFTMASLDLMGFT